MNTYIVIGLLLTMVVIIVFVIYKIFNFKKYIKLKIIDTTEKSLEKQLKQKQKEVDDKIQILTTNLKQQEKLLQEQKDKTAQLINERKIIIDKELENYNLKERNKIQLKYNDWNNSLKAQHNELIEQLELELNQFKDDMIIQKELYSLEINELKRVLDEYRTKRSTINDAIMREKQLQEQKDFYRIVLSPQDQEDIQMLKQIIPRLNNTQVINKLIYDMFIKTPLNEMLKRVLNGQKPSGIYKITYIPTQESYIGKSSDLHRRWTDHTKTACGLKGCAHSILHTRMEQEGIWNFTWEILELVDKDKLNEREAYYINFYDTKNYGLNIKAGNNT